MNFVGQYLRKKRILNKHSLDAVSIELKISKYILQKIENDEFDKSINIIFYIGHLRAYANFLNLNSNEIIFKATKLENLNYLDISLLEKFNLFPASDINSNASLKFLVNSNFSSSL